MIPKPYLTSRTPCVSPQSLLEINPKTLSPKTPDGRRTATRDSHPTHFGGKDVKHHRHTMETPYTHHGRKRDAHATDARYSFWGLLTLATQMGSDTQGDPK
jgi:hypothetical protein